VEFRFVGDEDGVGPEEVFLRGVVEGLRLGEGCVMDRPLLSNWTNPASLASISLVLPGHL
jgi:hypothetical protein